MLKTIREEPHVTQTLKRAIMLYPRVAYGYEALCWVLLHDEPVGISFVRNQNLYYLHKQAASPPLMPEIRVIYTISKYLITLHAITIG